jgi:phosphoadenosine phosphosulfate reductase
VTLLYSARHRPADRAHWEQLEEVDHVRAKRLIRSGKDLQAIDAIMAFAERDGCYASVSWGKDSTVLAHLVWRANQQGADIPLGWMRGWWANPDCDLVRDVFLAQHRIEYDQIDVENYDLSDEQWWRMAAKRWCPRHITGIRADESRVRRIRVSMGIETRYTCAPLGHWTGEDVFAYLAHFELPVHPAYACGRGGQMERERLRVDMLGEERGRGFGREEWEREYYSQEMSVIKARLAQERACR